MTYGGILVESLSAYGMTLKHVLSKYIERKFTGIVQYKVGDLQVTIGLVDGNIASCSTIRYVPVLLSSMFGETRRRTIVNGVECCEEVTRYLDDRTGVIEVYSVDRDLFITNLLITPYSRVESPTTLATILKTNVGVPAPRVERPLTPPLIVQPPPPPQPSITPPPAVKPPELRVLVEAPAKPPVKPEVEVFKELVVDECIDPLALYRVLRSSQLVESAESLGFKELVEKVKTIVEKTTPSLVYVSGVLEDSTVKILYNVQTKSVNIEIEKKETTLCGKSTLNYIQDKKVVNTRIWVVK